VPPEWLSTHPDLALRIEQLKNRAVEMNYAVTGDLVPLERALTEPE
jgi:predicted Zn-dependent protease